MLAKSPVVINQTKLKKQLTNQKPEKSQLSSGWQSYSVQESLKLLPSLWDYKDKNASPFCVKTTVMEDPYSGFSSSLPIPSLILVGFFLWCMALRQCILKLNFLLPENRKIILLPLGERTGPEKNYVSMTYIKIKNKKRNLLKREQWTFIYCLTETDFHVYMEGCCMTYMLLKSQLKPWSEWEFLACPGYEAVKTR